MFFENTCILHVAAALLLGGAQAQETHDGITFEVRWDADGAIETTAIKDAYEEAAGNQARERVTQAIKDTGYTTECVLADNTLASFYDYKVCIANEDPTAFFTLLADDIDAANDFWADIVDKSTTDRSQWVPARAYVKGYFNGSLTATNFAVWEESPFSTIQNPYANPEHYYFNQDVISETDSVSEIFEGWGGVVSSFGTIRTNFTVPSYTVPTFGQTADQPAEWAISSDFPLAFQRIGPKVLAYGDDSTFGMLHIAVRDVPATTEDPAAIEVYSAVWYPPYDKSSSEDHTEFVGAFCADESRHMVVEIIKDTLKAQEDCPTGLCTL